jgi:hypothetical protein
MPLTAAIECFIAVSVAQRAGRVVRPGEITAAC